MRRKKSTSQDGRYAYGKNSLNIVDSGDRHKVYEPTHKSGRLTGHQWLCKPLAEKSAAESFLDPAFVSALLDGQLAPFTLTADGFLPAPRPPPLFLTFGAAASFVPFGAIDSARVAHESRDPALGLL